MQLFIRFFMQVLHVIDQCLLHVLKILNICGPNKIVQL